MSSVAASANERITLTIITECVIGPGKSLAADHLAERARWFPCFDVGVLRPSWCGTGLAIALAALLSTALAQEEEACAPVTWVIEGGVVIHAEQRWIEGGYIRYAGGLCVETPAGVFTGGQARHAPGEELLEVDEAALTGLPVGTRLTARVVTVQLASGEITLTTLTLTLGESQVAAAAGRLASGGLEIPDRYRGGSPTWDWTGTGLRVDLTTGRHQGEAINLDGGPDEDPLSIFAASHTGAFTGPELDLVSLRIEIGRLTFISSGGVVRGGGFSARGVSLTSCVCAESPVLLFLAESLEVVPGVQRIVLRDAQIQAFGLTVARPGPFLGIDLSAIAALLPEPEFLIEEAGVTVLVRALPIGSDETGRLTADLGVSGFFGEGLRPELILNATGDIADATFQFRGGLGRPGPVLDARIVRPLGGSGLQASALASITHPEPDLSPTMRMGASLDGTLAVATGLELRPVLRAEIAGEPGVSDALAGAGLGVGYRTSTDGLAFTFDGEAGARAYATADPFLWASGRAGLEVAIGPALVTASYALRRGIGASPFVFDERPPLQELGFGLSVQVSGVQGGVELTYDLDAGAFDQLTLAANARITPWETLTLHPRVAFDIPANTFLSYGLELTVRTCCFEIRADAGYDEGRGTFRLGLGLRR